MNDVDGSEGEGGSYLAEDMVWVDSVASGKGECYHRSEDCEPELWLEVPAKFARDHGLRPCGNCLDRELEGQR